MVSMERTKSRMNPKRLFAAAVVALLTAVLAMGALPGATDKAWAASSGGKSGLTAAKVVKKTTKATKATTKKATKKQSLAKAAISLSVTSYSYDGNAKKPTPIVRLGGKKLTKGKHYTVSYKNNIKAGTATVVVKGKGSYAGTRSKAFKITRRSLAKASVALSKTAYVYDGKEKKPTATVKFAGKRLTRNTHFTVAYRANVNAGTAQVTIAGAGSYTGSVTKQFTIAPKPLTGAVIALSSTSLPYNGQPQRPGVAVRLSGKELRKGVDYEVSYQSNVAIGTPTVVVAGKGNYTAMASKSFKVIEPIVGQHVGIAYASEQTGGHCDVPPAKRDVAQLSLTATSSKTCSLVIEGRELKGRWRLDTHRDDDNRYYLLTFDEGRKWGAFYTKGTIKVVDLCDSNHYAIF